MNADAQLVSFGRYLKTLRLEKAIRLETVSRETRIGKHTLLLIEKEDYARLPAQVYVKGFIRQYARVIGADAETVVGLYLDGCRRYHEDARAGAGRNRRFWRRLWVGLVGLAGGVALVVMVAPRFSEDVLFHDRPTDRGAAAGARVTPPPADTPPRPPAETPPVIPHTLDITATEETWLKVIIDARSPETYHLVPGEYLRLTAASGFNLLVGSAAGVDLVLDGKPVGLSGKSGQVAAVQIP